MGETRNSYNNLDGHLKERDQLEDLDINSRKILN
jgi:hypothetical protein